jgi:hypothetical protein
MSRIEGEPLKKELKPSEVTEAFWIYRIRSFRDRDWGSHMYSGKWMIFLKKTELDAAWDKIYKALYEEKLGPACKVSTARPNSTQEDMDGGVIVCYTDDWSDKKDLERVRLAIRKLGFKETLFYKKDITTMQGIYGPKSWYIIDGKKKHPRSLKAKKKTVKKGKKK